LTLVTDFPAITKFENGTIGAVREFTEQRHLNSGNGVSLICYFIEI
jgi:hypothetical protein